MYYFLEIWSPKWEVEYWVWGHHQLVFQRNQLKMSPHQYYGQCGLTVGAVSEIRVRRLALKQAMPVRATYLHTGPFGERPSEICVPWEKEVVARVLPSLLCRSDEPMSVNILYKTKKPNTNMVIELFPLSQSSINIGFYHFYMLKFW